MSMKLSDLLQASGIVYGLNVVSGSDSAVNSENIEIEAITSDSRRVRERYLFVCIRGLKSDAHNFIADAVAQGAVAVVVEDESARVPDGIIVIHTGNSRAALARLWNAWYRHPGEGMHLVAVTGTNGKTSVTYMLREIFSSALALCGIIGTVTCHTPRRELKLAASDSSANMTTPDPEQLYAALDEMRRDGAEYVFIEATSHALDQHRLEPLHFDLAVFTNLTPEHLDYHGNMENYFLAKASLLKKCDKAIINADDAYASRYLSYAREHACACKTLLVSSHGLTSDYSAQSVRDMGSAGIVYTFRSPSGIRTLRCPVPGAFTVSNSLLAAACAGELGIGGRYISEALASFCGTPGRLERVRIGGGYPASVFIDYAHTPDALESLLTAARSFTPEGARLIVVFGCGGDRDRQKRPIMGGIATQLSDISIITADNSRSERTEDIIAEIVAGANGGGIHTEIVSRREAIAYAIEIAEKGDVILLAGKGHEQYEIDADGRHLFDEKETARAAAAKLTSRRRSESGKDSD